VKRPSVLVCLVALVVMLCTAAAEKASTGKFKYVGVKSCRSCHSSRKIGRQYQAWKKSPHAEGYEVLATSEAKGIADSLDIDDPQKHARCLECHITAFGVGPERLARALTVKSGIGCEGCHGPGEAYAVLGMMRAAASGTQDPAEIGLITKPPNGVCASCHNDRSPTYRPFTYGEAARKIAHPRPKARNP
jgi:hypothetical protein